MKEFIFALGAFVTTKESLQTVKEAQPGMRKWVSPVKVTILERRF